MKIAVSNLSLAYERRNVLHNISFTIQPGQKVALVGPNGSGKSTLLKALAGLVPGVSQHIMVNDKRLSLLPRRQIARQLALVAQQSYLNTGLTVEALVRLGRIPHRGLFSAWGERDNNALEHALNVTNLDALRHVSWPALSGGQQQRCQIARALAQQPQLLLLDEPTNHLDIQHQLELMKLVSRLPITVIVALHDLNLAMNYCDTVLMVKDGHLSASGDPQQVISEAQIFATYGVNSTLYTSQIGPDCLAFHPAPA